MGKIHIIGGGTFSHVRNHLALAAPAFGKTARRIAARFHDHLGYKSTGIDDLVSLHLTKMADPHSDLVTNDDVSALLDRLIADPETRVIILNVALCDYDGNVHDSGIEPGKYAPRLKTSDGELLLHLTPADKLVGKIRKERKDIYLVAFKTTTGATPHEQYLAGLDLLKKNSCNLVLANDTVTRNNMIIAPEETRYFETTDRGEVLDGLVQMVMARKDNTFTRSTVVDGDLVAFQSDPRVPQNLREVINYCVERGAYKPFNGATAGHFAVRLDDGNVLTSRRKTNYTVPGGLDLVHVEYEGFDKVIAHGAKPSVGGQSQRIVFTEHPDLDCIVHFHCPLKAKDSPVPVAPQWYNECGSHQCGANTSKHLRSLDGEIHAVMLADHGPNIVFGRNVPAEKVIAFIEEHFDLEAKTGGLVEPVREKVYA